MCEAPAAWKAAAILLITLTGCVTYKPDPLIPDAELEALAQRGFEPLPAELPQTIPTEWFPLEAEIDLADGLSLGEANALALFYSPRARAARTAADVSAGQLLQAGLLRNPELILGPRFSSSATSLFGGTLLFEIPLGGRRRAEKDKAESEAVAATLDVMIEELEVLIDVRTRFLRARALEEERRLLRVLAEQSDAAFRWTLRLEKGGEASPLAASLARLDRDEARQHLSEKDADYAAARAGLLEAVGLLATAPVTIALENELLALPPLPERDREVVLGHPRLKRLELSHRAAEHAVRVEVAKQYPELWIGPDYEYDQGLNTLGFGLMLEIPIFDRNRGGIAAAESGRTAAREQYQAEVLRLSRKEAAARARRKASLEILQQYRSETLQAVERAEQVIAGRLRGGESNILELLEARRAVARARLQAVSLSERVDIATLKAAYAGGWVLPRAPEGDTES